MLSRMSFSLYVKKYLTKFINVGFKRPNEDPLDTLEECNIKGVGRRKQAE